MKEIDAVVGNAFKKLSSELVMACIDNEYFVTMVSLNNGVPIKVNGVYNLPKPEQYVIIDTMNKMTYDKAEFIARSKQLWKVFDSIEKWYKC